MISFRHLTRTKQFDRSWIETSLFPLCERFRLDTAKDLMLPGKAIYCLFYEPSFLTRTSFERAISMLGGEAFHTEDASQFFPVRTPNYIDNVIDILASLHIDLVVLRSSDTGIFEVVEAKSPIPVINGGSVDDHPTQALADAYTLQRELGSIDGVRVAVVGRLEHRNVSALLCMLSLFEKVEVDLVPFSGRVDPEVEGYCHEQGLEMRLVKNLDCLSEADAIYLNGPRTLAHIQLMRSRDYYNLRIDEDFMSKMKPESVIMDPMQRSGDFIVESDDNRLAFYRQAENALFVRMAVLAQMLDSGA